MSKICVITGKKTNSGYSVSHSDVKTRKKQYVNLQKKKIWSQKQRRWIKMKISTKAIKSLRKLSLYK